MNRGQRGFLLHEWLVVMALAALMLSAVMVWGRGWRAGRVAGPWSRQLQAGLEQLRQRALLEERAWTLCASLNGSDCQSVWQGAWLVFVDSSNDGRRQAGEPLASFTPALPPGWRVIWRGFRGEPWLRWSEAGDAPASNGTLTLCPPGAHDAALRQLVIAKSGRVRLVQPARVGNASLQAARALCGWT